MARIIDRSAPAEGLAVERAAGRDVMGHISDVHAQAQMAVFQMLERDRVVKVARVVAVDREDCQIAQIKAARRFGWIDLLRRMGGLLRGVGGKVIDDAVCMENGRKVEK